MLYVLRLKLCCAISPLMNALAARAFSSAAAAAAAALSLVVRALFAAWKTKVSVLVAKGRARVGVAASVADWPKRIRDLQFLDHEG